MSKKVLPFPPPLLTGQLLAVIHYQKGNKERYTHTVFATQKLTSPSTAGIQPYTLHFICDHDRIKLGGLHGKVLRQAGRKDQINAQNGAFFHRVPPQDERASISTQPGRKEPTHMLALLPLRMGGEGGGHYLPNPGITLSFPKGPL